MRAGPRRLDPPRDSSHFQGAITRGDAPIEDDPFARLSPARLLRVEPGPLGWTRPLAGPTIERYGSAYLWPWDRYDAT